MKRNFAIVRYVRCRLTLSTAFVAIFACIQYGYMFFVIAPLVFQGPESPKVARRPIVLGFGVIIVAVVPAD